MSNPEPSENRLVTTAEAAELLGVSVSTVSNWRVERRGPSYVKSGPGPRARVRYRVSDVLAYMRTVPTSDQPSSSTVGAGRKGGAA